MFLFAIEKLVLYNFRNYIYIDENFDADLNILVGENAQGKQTSLRAYI